MQYIFVDKLSTLKLSDLTPTSFSCFKAYFSHVNRKLGKLSNQDELIELPLSGFDTLWEICLEVSNDAVFTAASDLLISLHKKVSEKEREQTRGMGTSTINYSICSSLKNSVEMPTKFVRAL
jgi:hypothetical protein